MNPNRVAIVFNPKGGSARERAAANLAAAFGGISVTVKPTTPAPGSACQLAKRAVAEGADLVIAMGGDGTACQVAEGLLGTGIPMAIFPGGTGNLFVRSFYSVPTAEEFVDMIKTGQPQPVDMIKLSYTDVSGHAHDRFFMVALGVGKLSDAISMTSTKLKRWLGKLAYIIRVGWAALKPSAHNYELELRGTKVSKRAASVLVLNVLPAHMAMMSRGCNASDGLMDVGVVGCTNVWQILKLGFWTLLGRPERSRRYTTLRTSELKLRSDRPVNPNIDGDPSHLTSELSLKVVPGAVSIVLAH